MSSLTNILGRVRESNPELAEDLEKEIMPLLNRLPFGLNFERHTPERVHLPDRKIRRGDKVVFRAPRGESNKNLDPRIWTVEHLEGRGEERIANLIEHGPVPPQAMTTRLTKDLIVVAEFRDPVYPGLRSTGKVERGGDRPFHTVINGENFYALETLLFAYEGKVDCIYIDPPYNTRDKDWKYNNDYVDSDDAYKHSKWLAMMERRLKLAKRLLNPEDSALIVTIDEKEYLRLGMLLEQIFPGCKIQMVTSVISSKGVIRDREFSRVEEYIFIVLLGTASIAPWNQNMLDAKTGKEKDGKTVDWLGLRRREPSSIRGARPNQFFPVYVNVLDGSFHSIGEPIKDGIDRNSIPPPKGAIAIWPLTPKGKEMLWGLTPESLRKLMKEGFARTRNWNPKKKTVAVQYLPEGTVAKIQLGEEIRTLGYDEDGAIQAIYQVSGKAMIPKRVWNQPSHNAEMGGTNMLTALIPDRSFPYPKSLYAVEDTLRFFVAGKPNALIVDFFSGSGTTAHAVMRLNKQNGGRRRSICITNNEVSAKEEALYTENGLRQGDHEWEHYGICEYITKPRIHAAITGKTHTGKAIEGNYKFIDIFPLADGFEENAEFFDLTYEDPERVRHDLSFSAIAPLLWMRAGSEGRRIHVPTTSFDVTDRYGVLFNLDASRAFVKAVREAPDLRVAYIVTDDQPQYQMVADELPHSVEPVRLYESYLTTFRINTGRD